MAEIFPAFFTAAVGFLRKHLPEKEGFTLGLVYKMIGKVAVTVGHPDSHT